MDLPSSLLMMASQIRQNYHAECEAAINHLVNIELHASYVYLSMAHHFDRDDVALCHVAKFLKEQSQEEKEHADKFLKYQNKRGGRIVLQDIKNEYLEEQVKAIKLLGDHCTNLRRLGLPQNGMGEYLFDKLTLRESS
ncbi:hypothetical protein Chor_001237 [Crotalus horridus]